MSPFWICRCDARRSRHPPRRSPDFGEVVHQGQTRNVNGPVDDRLTVGVRTAIHFDRPSESTPAPGPAADRHRVVFIDSGYLVAVEAPTARRACRKFGTASRQDRRSARGASSSRRSTSDSDPARRRHPRCVLVVGKRRHCATPIFSKRLPQRSQRVMQPRFHGAFADP
jgi:hypothetical protein